MSALRAAFERDGFVLTEPLLAEDEISALREGVVRVMEACSAAVGMARWLSLVNQIRGPERWDPVFERSRTDSRLHAAAGAALGEPVAFAWQHLVWRQPSCTVHLPWHADQVTWPEPARTRGGVALWLALDPSSRDAGGVRYAPGSHRSSRGELLETVCPVVPLGAAVLHHGGVLHSSGPNLTPRWRRALVMVFTPRS